jgi:fatty acid CoA ligase FadD9
MTIDADLPMSSPLPEQLASPPVARLLARRPALRDAVIAVLEAGNEVRALHAAALPPWPDSPHVSAERAGAEAGVLDAVAELELCGERPGADSATVESAIHRVLLAMADLRVQSHAYDQPRPAGDPACRRELVQALGRFRAALERLRHQARQVGEARLPWRIELASDVDPALPMAEVELEAPGFPATPGGEFPRGERCLLTGRPAGRDSHRRPTLRYRSLDDVTVVLSPRADGIARRVTAALRRLGPAHGDAVRRLVTAAPWLVASRIECLANPSFHRLGLLDVPSLAVATNNVLRAFADQPLIGQRRAGGTHRELALRDPAAALLGEGDQGFAWWTHETIRRRALGLTHGLEELGGDRRGRVGLISRRNEVEFFVADLACVFSNRVSVGLLDSLADDALFDIMATAEVEVLFTDGHNAARFLTGDARRRCPGLRVLVVSGAGEVSEAPDSGLRVLRFDDLVTDWDRMDPAWTSRSGVGRETPVLHHDTEGVRAMRTAGIAEDDDDAVYTLLFTSGTTGTAKGVAVSRPQWVDVMRPRTSLWPHVEVSYLPMALGSGRTMVWRTFAAGGRVGLARPDAGLLEDIRAIRPTLLEAPPSVLNALYGEYRRAVTDPTVDRRRLAEVKRGLRDDLGGRLAFLATGGAASEAVVRQTMGDVLGLPVVDGYGTTETGAIATDGRIRADVDFRLLEVPELGFTADDRPHPRGELAVRTPQTIRRYFAASAADQASFTEDGFFVTGDVVEMVGERRIRIIGRRKQCFKLAGAEFVHPDVLERHFMTSDLVRAVFVTGLPTESAVVAVVVPVDPSADTGSLLAGLRAVAGREGLRPHEIPKGVVVDPPVAGRLPWTPENGLLTATLKLDRRALDAHYADRIRDAYGRAETDTDHDVAPSDGGVRSVDRVRHLVANLLHLTFDEVDPSRTFADHGGGSLAALELVLCLRQVLPPGIAREKAADAASLTTTPLVDIAGWMAEGGPTVRTAERPRQAEVEDRRPIEIRSAGPVSDAATRANRDAAWCATPIPLPPERGPGGILLTGATGFLGVHLIPELAASLSAGQRLFALVRADDHRAAKQRLENALHDAELEAVDIAAGPSADGRVVALAGSLDVDAFGLDEGVYDQVAHDVGLIHHVGAVVTAGGAYEDLRDVNVGGTRRVLELAMSGRRKAVHFVSSLNVALLLAASGVRQVLEDTPLPETLTEDLVSRSLPYAVSKWVGERMLHNLVAVTEGAIQVSISRPALITWSTRTGVANDTDWFTRTLRSCVELGCLIGLPEAGVARWMPRIPATATGMDLVPVDFVARAVRRLGELTRTGALPPILPVGRAPTFHISNLAPDEQGLVSVAHLMDLMMAATLRVAGPGISLRTLPMSDWLLEVEAEGASALPVLDQLAHLRPDQPRTRAERFAAAMTGPHPDGDIHCPPIDRELVERFVRRVLRPSG